MAPNANNNSAARGQGQGSQRGQAPHRGRGRGQHRGRGQTQWRGGSNRGGFDGSRGGSSAANSQNWRPDATNNQSQGSTGQMEGIQDTPAQSQDASVTALAQRVSATTMPSTSQAPAKKSYARAGEAQLGIPPVDSEDEDDREDDDEDHDEGGGDGLAAPMSTHELIVDSKKLEDNLVLIPEWEREIYPQHLDIVYGQLQAHDAPSNARLTDDRQRADKLAPIKITFRHFKDHREGIFTVGEFAKKTVTNSNGENGKAPYPVKLSWIMHSQLQGFTLHVNRNRVTGTGKKSDVVVHFHMNNLRAFNDGNSVRPGFRFSTLENLRDQAKLDANSGIDISAAHYWAIDAKIWRQGDATDLFPGVNCEPKFYGITDEELRQIKSAGDAGRLQYGGPALSQGEWVLYGLLTCREFTMYRKWGTSENAVNVENYFRKWTTTVFNDILTNGHWPYYVRLAKSELTEGNEGIWDPYFDIGHSYPPRHMVKEWRLTPVGNNGKMVKTAETWVGFEPLSAYPDAKSKEFALLLGIERGRDRTQRAIQDKLDENVDNTHGRFFKLGAKGSFYVEISLGDKRGGVSVPATSTRLKLQVVEAGPYFNWTFSGAVTEDAFNRGCDFAATVQLKGFGNRDLKGADTSLLVSVRLMDDATPTSRQLAAIKELGKDVNPDKGGMDARSVFFECPVSIKDTGSLAAEVRNNNEATRIVNDVCTDWGLNQEQGEATIFSFTSESGLVAVWGPPGTGKTYCEMAVAEAHIRVGRLPNVISRPIVCTAPSNTAVDNMLSTMRNTQMKLGRKDIKMVRFRGAELTMPVAREAKDNEAIKQCLIDLKRAQDPEPDTEKPAKPASAEDEEFWTIWKDIDARTKDTSRYAAGHNAEYEWSAMRKAFLKECRRDKTSPHHQRAWAIIDRIKEIKNASGDEKARLKAELETYEHFMSKEFAKTIDIVFVTNNSSAHPVLTTYFEPVILMSDEVANAALSDQATPVAAFKETLKLFYASGDHRQLGPQAPARHASETHSEVTKSIFERLKDDASLREKVQLLEQHRMAPVHSRMVSSLFYGGTLRDHQSVIGPTALDSQLEKILSPLKPVWNGDLRIMVHVGGHGIYSEVDAETGTLSNKWEAKLLIDHIDFLLKKGVKRSDILVISGYKGQVQLIKTGLLERRLNHIKDEVDIRVMTSAAVQGSESPIVLFSMVRNVPDDPYQWGFIRTPRQLCVNMSRVQRYQINFGNVKHLVQGVIDEHLPFKKGRLLHKLGLLVKDFNDCHQLVSSNHLHHLHSGEKIARRRARGRGKRNRNRNRADQDDITTEPRVEDTPTAPQSKRVRTVEDENDVPMKETYMKD